ncbi:MAG: hypothetical protein M0R17_09445 [Candidatus Omnitrophica bacterium]|jgi:hypothetical protein|nr:hypothetical protein [Candidatus Omnitrophota bacterium]
MSFKKVSKEEWLKLSQEEKDYLTFEFNKSVEKRKKLTIILTRSLALICIFVLFWIGFVQFKAVNNYNEIIDEYGSDGYCYLCGEYSLKKCECQYFESSFIINNPNLFENYSTNLANYNTQKCSSLKVNDNEVINQIVTGINISNLNINS